ncbi:transporter family protein [Nocardioides thalensis]|uniref:Transporter family protein n=1 Tax=Nocardioides thalensis TaxID=1914755 RepID=A0A853C0D4_9ACTN|nr:EamA family transporter [Nocardioides thalensis]NYJ00661.1 transporter family protein [Nocardioides thalensis]
MDLTSAWWFWALLSAFFAALTAIFAKVGVKEIDSDVATFIRTIVILVTLGLILLAVGKFHSPGEISTRTWLFLVLSGLATGASWICYFRALKVGDASLVAPVDKLSVVLVAVFGVTFLSERLSGLQWVGILLVGGGAVLLAVTG